MSDSTRKMRVKTGKERRIMKNKSQNMDKGETVHEKLENLKNERQNMNKEI